MVNAAKVKSNDQCNKINDQYSKEQRAESKKEVFVLNRTNVFFSVMAQIRDSGLESEILGSNPRFWGRI